MIQLSGIPAHTKQLDPKHQRRHLIVVSQLYSAVKIEQIVPSLSLIQ
jgi:hypothetical protein